MLFSANSTTSAFPLPPISASNIKTFQAWTVLSINEGGNQYVNLCAQMGNSLSTFRIHLTPDNKIGYTTSLNNPALYYPDAVTIGQATITVGNNQHFVQVTNTFTGSIVVSYLNLSPDFINQIKNKSNFIVSFPIGPPCIVSMAGFNQALKYAKQLLKKM